MVNDSALFNVDVENYKGPLDVLLDLAKAQKVNLEDISITKLADQFHDFISNFNANGYVISDHTQIFTSIFSIRCRIASCHKEND